MTKKKVTAGIKRILKKVFQLIEDRKTDNWKLTDDTDDFSSKWQFPFKQNKEKWGWKSQYGFFDGENRAKEKD